MPPARDRPRRGSSLRTRLVLLGTVAPGGRVGRRRGGADVVLRARAGAGRPTRPPGRPRRRCAELIDGDRLPDPIPPAGPRWCRWSTSRAGCWPPRRAPTGWSPALPADELAGRAAGPITVRARLRRAGPVRVVALPPAGRMAARVVSSPRRRATSTTRCGWCGLSLIVGFALLLAVLAVVAWRVVGATLRPGRGAAGRRRERSPAPARRTPCRCPTRPTRSAGSP